MALIVHKYGGTSMGSTERIANVAKRVAKWARAGHRMVVVPSAMSGETNRLLGLAKELAPAKPGEDYRRELDIDHALNRLSYTQQGVRFTREALASHPAQVIAWRLTSDQPGRYTGRVTLTDRHGAAIGVTSQSLAAVGTLPNGLAYASQLRVVNDGGTVAVDGNTLRFSGCNSRPSRGATRSR